MNLSYKQAISTYATGHFVEFGQVLQVGTGTTPNAFMRETIEHQKRTCTGYDLTILTTNLEIVQMGKEAAEEHPKIFGSTQVIITGGGLLTSLNSLVGEYAAKNIATDFVRPDLVVLGVWGISFELPFGQICYHFNEELTTQEALATRPTEHRLILCDHVKLGKTVGWKARVSLLSLLENTNRCTIVSSYPDTSEKNFKEHTESAERSFAAFKSLMTHWREGKSTQSSEQPHPLAKKQFVLRLINLKGEVIKEAGLWDHLLVRSPLAES